jgi:hypothetical protein
LCKNGWGFVSGHFFTRIGITLYNAGDGSQTSIYKQEGNAYHCMSLPTGIAFSENGNWANSPGVYDANHNGGAALLVALCGQVIWRCV